MEQAKDEHVTKKYKQEMQQAFQDHQLKVVQMVPQRLEKDLAEICKCLHLILGKGR